MNRQIRRYFVTLIIVFVICCFGMSISYARVWGNWRDCVTTLCTGDSSTSLLSTNIIASAGFFLKSHSDYQNFLNQVEMSDINVINYAEFKETIYSAIENMEKAKVGYTNFIINTGNISYNPIIIEKLIKFDYDGFRVKYGLNAPIFDNVKKLLVKGDITGLDSAMLYNIGTILKQLYELKSLVDKDQVLENSLLWRLNQSYFEAQLFGQYVSEVIKANL